LNSEFRDNLMGRSRAKRDRSAYDDVWICPLARRLPG
jgi:hypothetical protein